MKTTSTLTTERVFINFRPDLSEKEREFITDIKSKNLNQVPEVEKQKFCSELVLKCYADTGQYNVNKDVAKQMIRGLLEELKPYEMKLSLYGLKNAITRGIRKEYGEYYGINSVSFNMFLKSYINSQERSNAIIKQREHEIKVANDRQAVETMDASQNFTIYCYQKYKEEDVIYDPAQTAYDWLKKKKLIPFFTKELKESIKAEAEARYMNFKLNGENKGVLASQNILNKIAARKEKKLTYDEEIINLCKQLHLRIIFDQITLEQIEQANDKQNIQM